MLEWPQPIRSSYSSSEYWASWKRTSAFSATDAPESQSVDRAAITPASAGSWSGRYAKLEVGVSTRKPTVGPGWTTRSAVSVAPASVHGARGTSWNSRSAGTAARSIGKSGGENDRPMRSLRLRSGDGGPQMSIVVCASQSGPKKRRPSTWSRWRCVRSRWTRFVPRSSSCWPSRRMPVPASSTSAVPLSKETSTHEVLPPHSSVSGPGVGTEPRQPQIVRRTSRLRLLMPEDRHHPDKLVGVGEERERRDRDVAIAPVEARDPKLLVRGPPLVERDPRRPAAGGQRLLRVAGPRHEAPGPVVERHLAGLGERAPDDVLSGLVVEDELTLVVCDQRGCGEVRRELAREDQDEVLVSPRHKPSVRPQMGEDRSRFA